MIRLTPPTREKYVSSGWGQPRAYRGGWHEGLDFPSPVGSPVLAAADGEVVHVKNVDTSFAGKWIAIHHGDGIHTRYLHNDRNLVTRGQRVKRGQQIATVGITGTSGRGAPHSHFDVKMLYPAFVNYQQTYGTPTTGWGSEMSGLGWGVPAETFMDDVTYKDGGAAAKARGVVFYQFPLWLKVTLIGAGGFALYRILR